MDRVTANTLRTLGIVATAIVVFIGALLLLLLALCFGAATQSSNPGVGAFALVFLALAVGLVIGGIAVIGRLAKAMVRDSNGAEQSYAPVPRQESNEPRVVDLDADPEPAAAHAGLPTSSPRQAGTQEYGSRVHDLARHLSPASRTAIEELVLAIVVTLVAQFGVVLYAWISTLHGVSPLMAGPRYSILLSGLSAAPPLLLIYFLFQKPGAGTFAYALAIPSVHLLMGLIGHLGAVFVLMRVPAASRMPVLLGIVPWLLNGFILHRAWQVLRKTGVMPEAAQIIVAAAVMFFYSLAVPALMMSVLWSTMLGRR